MNGAKCAEGVDEPEDRWEDGESVLALVESRRLKACTWSHHLAFVSSTFSEMECKITEV